jgi:hypothetical protein
LLGAHQNGKGDADRSPGYRKNYDEINFNRWTQVDDGFKRVTPNRIRKTYGAQRSYPTIAGGDFDRVAPIAPGTIVTVPGKYIMPTLPPGSSECCGGDCGCHKPD